MPQMSPTSWIILFITLMAILMINLSNSTNIWNNTASQMKLNKKESTIKW